MFQFLIGVFTGIVIVLVILYILIIDPWAPASNQSQPPINQFKPARIPDELRAFLKSGNDGQGISRWESCNSITLLLHMLFQEHKDNRNLRRWVHKRLQMELNDITTRSAAGRLIQEIRIRELSLGTKFMTINSIRVENVDMGEDKNTFEKIVFVLDIDYSGGFETSIDVSTIIAKRASLSVKITKLTGMVRVILSRQPYHHWTFSFVSQPIFETEINSQIQGHQLKRLIPIIKEAIRRSLQRKHVWPNYKIRYRPFFPNPIFQASPPSNSFSHIKMEGGLEVTVLQCSRLKNSIINDSNANYEAFCSVTIDSRPLVHNEEQGHCVSVLLTFSRVDLSTPIGIVFDKMINQSASNTQSRPVKVFSVEDNSLADKSGFKPGDVLVAVNNVPIRSERQASRFLQQTTGDLMVLVERSLEDIDDEHDSKDDEIIVNSVRDAEDFDTENKIETTTERLMTTSLKLPREDGRNESSNISRRHSVSNFDSSIMGTNTDSLTSSVLSLENPRLEKPIGVSVQRAESARVPQVLVSQPSFDLRRTQSESRIDAKVIDAIISSSSDFAAENSVEDDIRCMLSTLEPPTLNKKIDKDRTLTQADAAKGLAMLSSATGSVASLSSVISNKTDTGTEGDGFEDEESSGLSRIRPSSTRRMKLQATLAAGKKRVLDLMPQKKKTSDVLDMNGESIEIGADAGSLCDAERENISGPKGNPIEEKKEKKKLKKKLSDSPKSRGQATKKSESPMPPSGKTRSTKAVELQSDVMWGQSLHFELDATARVPMRYLNVTVYGREVKPLNTPSCSTRHGSVPVTPESPSESISNSSTSSPVSKHLDANQKPIALGSISLFIPQLLDDCRLTISNCHREVFQLKQPQQIPTTSANSEKNESVFTEFSRHAGFDPRLCFGDITLGFRYFPNGLPVGTAVNVGDESDEEVVRVLNGNLESTAPGRPFSPPVMSPANHEWKTWYGRSSAVCAMCRGKIWLRNASCCGRCLVICHNKCVVKANQGGIACSPLIQIENDDKFEELEIPINEQNLQIPTEEFYEQYQTSAQSPQSYDIPDQSKRARFRKVTEKFSNWRKSGRRREDEQKKNELDRMSQQSVNSMTSTTTTASDWSVDTAARQDSGRDSPMACIQDVLADVLPTLDGSPFINGLYFEPGNAYSEQTIRSAKLLGRQIFSELPCDNRIEKINSQIDRIQTAIRETKDNRKNATQVGGESCSKFQGLDERLQALEVLMLHYCSALQDCQSGRSTPGPATEMNEKNQQNGYNENVNGENTVVRDTSRPNHLLGHDNSLNRPLQ